MHYIPLRKRWRTAQCQFFFFRVIVSIRVRVEGAHVSELKAGLFNIEARSEDCYLISDWGVVKHASLAQPSPIMPI